MTAVQLTFEYINKLSQVTTFVQTIFRSSPEMIGTHIYVKEHGWVHVSFSNIFSWLERFAREVNAHDIGDEAMRSSIKYQQFDYKHVDSILITAELMHFLVLANTILGKLDLCVSLPGLAPKPYKLKSLAYQQYKKSERSCIR